MTVKDEWAGCPWRYTARPQTRKQAQNNLSCWVWRGLTEVEGLEPHLVAAWPVYIRENIRLARKELEEFDQ